jgi:hypothetical protein
MPTNATPATNDATRDTTGRDSDATPGAFVASIGDAAKSLGVSIRTVQRRIERGQMSVIERDGRRFVQLPNGTPTDATPGATGDATPRQVDATPRQNDATGRDSDAERIAELKAEVAFLRNVVEAQQRDGAETRAALREALKLAPKQLNAAPPERPTAPPTDTATKDSRPTKRSAQKPTGTQESAPITYDSIADELERMLQ